MVGGSRRIRAGWVVAASGTPVCASADGGIDDNRNAHRDIFKNKDDKRREENRREEKSREQNRTEQKRREEKKKIRQYEKT
jgi:hypothetical protein